MRALVVGAGPAGLAFAALLAELDRKNDVTVLERNTADADPGWGVTLRTHALSFLGMDATLSPQILDGRAFWYRGECVVSLPYPPTVGCATIPRATLLRALGRRCESAGVRLKFETEGASLGETDLDGYDLVVAADGANSALRTRHADAFGPSVTPGENYYAWLATEMPFDKLTILLRDGDIPLMAWAYRFTEARSTFIVESTEGGLERSGLSRVDPAEACKTIGRVFQQELRGRPVLSGGPLRWQRFPMLSCAKLVHRNIALLGDAAHTTHYSQGFGTMFAFDDAIALKDALAEGGTVREALARYEAAQQPKIREFQGAATTSMRWAEATVRAAERHDERAVRELIEARWPNNAVMAAPMGSYGRTS